MASSTAKTKSTQSKATEKVSSYSGAMEKINGLLSAYGNMPIDNVYSAFMRAGNYWSNLPSVQNSRVKAISPLPADFTKEELGEFLRNPAQSELPLQQVAEGLKWTAYPFYKIGKSYQDIPTYKNYVIPQYIDNETVKTENFKRELKLVDKVRKACNIPEIGHKVTGQAMMQGKVFYIMRSNIDKSHNKVNTIFFQELPKSWSIIIGFNNISTYTLSFNLMYFLQPGTDYRQFGDLFEPYMNEFDVWLSTPESERKISKRGEKFVYAARNNATIEGERRTWQQNGRWFYYVSLPIDRVWTFEIDDTTPIVASPLSGLMQTFAQQADYEAAQLSLILNPLIKIFTGEIPYCQSNGARDDDGLRLSLGLRAVFEGYWNNLMAQTNTSGTAFYTAPVENIKSHDYAESANANSVSQSFLTYGMSKTGLSGIVPITDRPTQGTAEISAKLEAKYPQCIYRTLEKMINYLLDSLNLSYEWRVHIFGDIYSDEITRANALKELDKGDLSQYFILAALNDQSVLDKVAMCDVISGVGLLDRLQVPQTAYTQSGKSQPKSQTGGAPSKDQTQVEETKIEKQVEVTEE